MEMTFSGAILNNTKKDRKEGNSNIRLKLVVNKIKKNIKKAD